MQAMVTDVNRVMYSRIKHTYTHSHACWHCSQTDIYWHTNTYHQNTYTDNVYPHLWKTYRNKQTFNGTLADIHTYTLTQRMFTWHTNPFTFDFVSLVEADLAVPLGWVRAGGHKHTARHGTVEPPPLPACCALTTDRASSVQRHTYQTTGLTFIYAHLLPARFIQVSIFTRREYWWWFRHRVRWMTSYNLLSHPCLPRVCRLRSSRSPVRPRDGERVRAPRGLLELRKVPPCFRPWQIDINMMSNNYSLNIQTNRIKPYCTQCQTKRSRFGWSAWPS